MERGRTAVSPLRLERRVLHSEMARPDEAPVMSSANDLSVAEPRVDPLAVGDRCRRSEVVLLVNLGNGPVARVRYSQRRGRPIGGTLRRRARSGSRSNRRGRSQDVGRRSGSRARRARGRRAPVADDRLRPQLAVRPICEVTMTRSFQTMGDEVPSPARGVRHAMFSLALHVVGRSDSDDTPWLDGPRHCGQFSAESSTPDKTRAASQTSVRASLPRQSTRSRPSVQRVEA